MVNRLIYVKKSMLDLLLDKINGVFSYINAHPTLKTVFIGAITTFIGTGMIKCTTIAYNFLTATTYRIQQGFKISGYWIGVFQARSNNFVLEILKVKQHKENVKFYLQHYSIKLGSKTTHFLGKGIFRANRFTTIYYPIRSNKQTSGAFILKINDKSGASSPLELIGNFFEYDNNEIISSQHNDYKLIYTNKIPILNRVKFNLRMRAFHHFKDLQQFYDSFCNQ